MAKSNRGGRRANTATQQTNTANNTTNTTVNAPIGKYIVMTDAMAQTLRDDVDDRYTSDVRDAIKNYISKATDSKGFSMSQNLNYHLDNNTKLDATEKFIDKYIQQGMHPIGNDVVLTRACHDNCLQDLGIKDYSKMTEAQLKQALVGGTYTTKSYDSFSYDDNKNPFLTGPNAGGREVIIKAKVSAKTPIVFGAKSQSEIIVNKGTDRKITNVYFNGKTATPRGRGSLPQVVIEVEI
jgi:hypothetical protein